VSIRCYRSRVKIARSSCFRDNSNCCDFETRLLPSVCSRPFRREGGGVSIAAIHERIPGPLTREGHWETIELARLTLPLLARRSLKQWSLIAAFRRVPLPRTLNNSRSESSRVMVPSRAAAQAVFGGRCREGDRPRRPCGLEWVGAPLRGGMRSLRSVDCPGNDNDTTILTSTGLAVSENCTGFHASGAPEVPGGRQPASSRTRS
jgi:hypothetical protein